MPCFGAMFFSYLFEAVALVVLEPARDAEARVPVRDVDDEAARAARSQWSGGRPSSSSGPRPPGRAPPRRGWDEVGDRRLTGARALELRADDLVDEEEAVLLQADLDERRLHAGQHVVDDALVDVPGDRAPPGPLEVDLGDPPSSRTATRCSPMSTETRARASRPGAARGAAAGGAWAAGLLRRPSFRLARSRRRRLLAPPASPPRPSRSRPRGGLRRSRRRASAAAFCSAASPVSGAACFGASGLGAASGAGA